MKNSRFLRSAVENLYVQITFHAVGGAGVGLLAAQLLPVTVAVVAGVLFVSAAVLGHWYAVWSDPSPR